MIAARNFHGTGRRMKRHRPTKRPAPPSAASALPKKIDTSGGTMPRKPITATPATTRKKLIAQSRRYGERSRKASRLIAAALTRLTMAVNKSAVVMSRCIANLNAFDSGSRNRRRSRA